MSKSNIVELSGRGEFTDTLTELVRTGARQIIQQAVEAELKEFMERFSERLLTNGKSAVIRNGYHPERAIQTGIGPVTVRIPKVRSKEGKPATVYPSGKNAPMVTLYPTN